MADAAHVDSETFAGWRNCFAVAGSHGFRERAFHHADHTRPVCRSKLNWMSLNAHIRRVNEHHLQIVQMSLQSRGFTPVWPVDDDIFRMTLTQFLPILLSQDAEVEGVQTPEVLMEVPLMVSKPRDSSVLAETCRSEQCEARDCSDCERSAVTHCARDSNSYARLTKTFRDKFATEPRGESTAAARCVEIGDQPTRTLSI